MKFRRPISLFCVSRSWSSEGSRKARVHSLLATRPLSFGSLAPKEKIPKIYSRIVAIIDKRAYHAHSAMNDRVDTGEALSDRDKAMGGWLLFSAGLVFGMVLVGGLTRLTESGLSMVDWSLLHYKTPSNINEWTAYFIQYQATPEYQLLNKGMTLEEFKKIYYMEYSHRMLGRLIGAVYFFPLIYFLVTRRRTLSRGQVKAMLGTAALIFAQGLLGWYMVKSGLDPTIVQENSIPRVSQYRLAAHLGMAFFIYLLMLKQGLFALQPFPLVGKATATAQQLKMLKRSTLVSAKLVFLTALSGAFVAGLDAGLLYNTFPKMGLEWIPSDAYLSKPSLLADLFENPTTVQLNHRILAMASLSSIVVVWFVSKRFVHFRPLKRAAHVYLSVALMQVALGISTLLYLVPVPLAAAHQCGSLTLLTIATYMLHVMKRMPSII